MDNRRVMAIVAVALSVLALATSATFWILTASYPDCTETGGGGHLGECFLYELGPAMYMVAALIAGAVAMVWAVPAVFHVVKVEWAPWTSVASAAASALTCAGLFFSQLGPAFAGEVELFGWLLLAALFGTYAGYCFTYARAPSESESTGATEAA